MALQGSRVLVVGGGHNGLVGAILAAQAGASVTLLEAADHLGGASIGTRVFSGQPVRLSRYSYLVSLLPQELIARLGIRLDLASREVSSYTPVRRDGRASGLLVERRAGSATADSFRALTGSDGEYEAWQQFYGELAAMAAVLAPALTGPMRRRSEVRQAVIEAAGAQLWTDLFESPIGAAITRRFNDDIVRGVVGTDGLIGTHTSLFDESLLANRCFLYHLIGRGTGEWLVPTGGMGAVADALTDRARQAGVRIVTDARVTQASEDATGVGVATADGREFAADHLLAAVAPAVVDGWLGRTVTKPVGAQMKINMLLDRLPRLASGVDPAVAFAGTTHLEEGLGQLEAAYRDSAAGRIPDPMPGEVYCHSLTDPSILNGAFGRHADPVRVAYPGCPVRRGSGRGPTAGGHGGAQCTAAAPGRTTRGLPRPGRGRRVVPGRRFSTGCGGRGRHARRQHLPRRPELALAGRRDRSEPGSALRHGHRRQHPDPAGRRGHRPRWRSVGPGRRGRGRHPAQLSRSRAIRARWSLPPIRSVRVPSTVKPLPFNNT